jgi:oxygen-dependent protoporphyrinogen oxidase
VSGRKRVAIVGGGIAGLAAAYDLARSVREERLPIECRLFEASGSFGGVIRTERADGFLLDLGPDALFRGKPAAAQLAREIGLEGELINALPQRSPALIYSRGRLYPLPEGLELVAPTRILPFMASRLISPAGKLRMMLEPFIPARRDGEDESIARFIRRRFGEQALERMAGPLLAGIHAGDPERLSIRSTFPRLPRATRGRLRPAPPSSPSGAGCGSSSRGWRSASSRPACRLGAASSGSSGRRRGTVFIWRGERRGRRIPASSPCRVRLPHPCWRR